MNNLFIIEGPAGFSVRHNSTNREVRFLPRSAGWNRENAELVAMVADDIIEIRLRQEVEEAEEVLEEIAHVRFQTARKPARKSA